LRTPRLIEMLRSPAYRALSRAAHQVLARIEIELADHGGMDNGKLPFFTSTNCCSSGNNCNRSFVRAEFIMENWSSSSSLQRQQM
jgi:hypothetical protein